MLHDAGQKMVTSKKKLVDNEFYKELFEISSELEEVIGLC